MQISVSSRGNLGAACTLKPQCCRSDSRSETAVSQIKMSLPYCEKSSLPRPPPVHQTLVQALACS